MVKLEYEIRSEVSRLEKAIKFCDEAIIDFADDASVLHNFLVARSKYNHRLDTLKWVLNEKS